MLDTLIGLSPLLLICFLFVTFGLFGVKIIPQQEVWIIERFGKFKDSLESGLNIIIPFADKIAYKHTLKERAIDVFEQAAITKDNVTLIIDGIIYIKITNPVDASYGIENPYYAVTQLAQTSMRSALGKLDMEKTFEERDLLNLQIVKAINEAAVKWGIQCMRYEIRDIKPPASVVKAMETQVAAERQKRAEILESEGKMQAIMNIAEGRKQEVILNSQAVMQQQVNKAIGESEAIVKVSNATAESINIIGKTLQVKGGSEVISLKITERYIDAFKELAKTNNTMIIPASAGEPAAFIAQIMGIYNNVSNQNNINTKKLKNDGD